MGTFRIDTGIWDYERKKVEGNKKPTNHIQGR
jgi:hypothetical protein